MIKDEKQNIIRRLVIDSIEWHEENLKNSKISLENDLKRLLMVMRDYYIHEANVYKLEEQIKRAKKEGRTSFDSEKFNVRK